VEGIQMPIIIGLFIASCLLMAYFLLLFYGIKDKNLNLKIIGCFTLGISVIIASIIGIINFCARPDKYLPFGGMVRKAVSATFERKNRIWE
jgi:hypothetical protein